MNDLIEVGVYGDEGSATRGVQLYRSMHRIKVGAQQITVLVNAKLPRAGIDPRNLLIETEPGDNMTAVTSGYPPVAPTPSPSRSAATSPARGAGKGATTPGWTSSTR